MGHVIIKLPSGKYERFDGEPVESLGTRIYSKYIAPMLAGDGYAIGAVEEHTAYVSFDLLQEWRAKLQPGVDKDYLASHVRARDLTELDAETVAGALANWT